MLKKKMACHQRKFFRQGSFFSSMISISSDSKAVAVCLKIFLGNFRPRKTLACLFSIDLLSSTTLILFIWADSLAFVRADSPRWSITLWSDVRRRRRMEVASLFRFDLSRNSSLSECSGWSCKFLPRVSGELAFFSSASMVVGVGTSTSSSSFFLSAE